MILPELKKELVRFALELVSVCKTSQGMRQAAYKQYAQWVETGRQSGDLAMANMLYSHVDRLHSHLFSPTDLRFAIDYENHYGKRELAMADMAGRVLTREWERRNIDTVFASGVRESLVYGACIPKLLASGTGDSDVNLTARLVMPWQFAVYNETVTEIEDQECVVETAFLTKPEVWRRIAHLPDAEKMFQKIVHGSNKTEGDGTPTSYFHQVLSTMALDTQMTSASSQLPGGIVQLTNGPSYGVMGPQIGVDIFPMYELWVKNDDTNDYTTIQLFEPDILIAPLYGRKNLLCPGALPYRVIRPNDTANYFWGRSELVDLMQLQQGLTTSMDDLKRLIGNQVDKLLAFSGDGLSDETYGQFRAQGWVNLGPNGQVNDLTPKIPSEIFKYIEMIEAMMEKVGGFSNILSGQGEAGVRAGNHAEMLMKTASPRLRDRSLLVERQCASFADLALTILEAKEAKSFWLEEDKTENGEFLLSQLPEDRRVIVDSHSSSPIFQDDHQQQVAFGLKAGFLGGDSAIELLNFPNKDILKERYKDIQKAKAQQEQAEQAAEVKKEELKHPQEALRAVK